eukprot:TRINITY_DN7357_c0_g1_i12.p1 TRINITY_DN7357_c0_g1~~TRINITY_DN7357_c0_g1_i12.p1  ORF type:complete len:427 (-),score=79.89 TRINITY_DN7357_c0_g1_i12:85-1272(-)
MYCRFYKKDKKKQYLVISNSLLPRFHPKFTRNQKCHWNVENQTVDEVQILLKQFEATGMMDNINEMLQGPEWWKQKRSKLIGLNPFDQHVIVENADAEHDEEQESDDEDDESEEEYVVTEKSKKLQKYEQQRLNSPDAQKMIGVRKELPAWSKQEQILEALKKNQVVLISGATGCGKTTQVPQFILEEQIRQGRGSDTFIMCTQPRRISALSVAERVAQERGENIGSTVGYQIRLEDIQTQNTKLLFCTTGVLLRKIQNDPKLKGVSHVVIDEIHERNKNEDFLLILLKEILPARPDLRVVLMSATLNAEAFQKYIGGDQCPRIEIPGRTFPVENYYLEDILDMTGIELYSPEALQIKDKRFKPKPIAKDGFSGYPALVKLPAYDSGEEQQQKLK